MLLHIDVCFISYLGKLRAILHLHLAGELAFLASENVTLR